MDNKKKPQVWLPLLFSITLIIGMMLGYRMKGTMPGKNFFTVDKPRPMQEMLDLIQNKYVDEVKLNELTDTAIAAILSKLDPHSVFISAEEVESTNEDIAGNFFGIGVEFDVIDDTINIMYVVPDGPSFKAGIETGDKFIKVNDSLVAGVKIKSATIKKLLRGGNGTSVKVDLLRSNQRKTLTFQRGIIPVTSVDAAYMIEPGTGYIRLNKFSQVTYREFMQSLEKLKTQGLQKLILDLRGNGGGVLDQATEIADEFLEGDKLITYTEGKHFPKKEYRCKRPGMFEKGALVLLADEGTASASEILIGALQDWNRATIVGRRSFGKGLVQEQYDLSNGSALRLTVARYYTPVGRSIQRPYSNGEKAYYDEILKRFHDGEVLSVDSVKNDTTKMYKTPNGKIVYGGGGITPDVFVALDTAGMDTAVSKLYMTGAMADFAYEYYIQNKAALQAYKTTKAFAEQFSLSDDHWKRFEMMANKDSVQINTLSQKVKNELAFKLKASLARQVWRNEGFYEVLNTKDDAVTQALLLLKK
ncbi:MAG: S41 family peptidase [Chitinophagaceae bacterium]|nr:S41 family peptidase [Chitinophagaceae bacterium]